MASSPVFIGAPKVWQQQISTANTARDGSGTIGTIMSAGASGSRISGIRIMSVGTVTAGMIRFFINDGTNKYLWKERPVIAVTASGSAAGFDDEFIIPDGLVLPTGWSLLAATNNAEVFNIFAYGGDI